MTSLRAEGFASTVVPLSNVSSSGEGLYAHHVAQVHDALAGLVDQPIVAVAHSGGGNLLALLEPNEIAAYVFLDAIFPLHTASRFDLFDDPATVQNWRNIAAKNRNQIPKSMLARFGNEILDDDIRTAFIADLIDVPIKLYEESIPVHAGWPSSKPGLYQRWTASYAADAARARTAGFEVQCCLTGHFRMINQAADVAVELRDFVRAIA